MLEKDKEEKEKHYQNALENRVILEKFDRPQILKVYFSRLDGRLPDEIPVELQELYEIELHIIKAYLLGQHPQDTILQKIFRIMS